MALWGVEEWTAAARAGEAEGGYAAAEVPLFGGVPRRPRTALYCSPLLYEQILMLQVRRAAGSRVCVGGGGYIHD